MSAPKWYEARDARPYGVINPADRPHRHSDGTFGYDAWKYDGNRFQKQHVNDPKQWGAWGR